MSLRRVLLMIGCILSIIGVCVPMYIVKAGTKTEGIISLISGNSVIYGIVIIVADLVVIGSAIVALKKGYVIATFISAGLTFYSCWNMMISKESAAAILGLTSKYMSSLGGQQLSYSIDDGPAMVLLLLGAAVMLITMIWCGFAED